MTDPSLVGIIGSLQPCAAGFATELARQGYTPRSLQTQLHLMAQETFPADAVASDGACQPLAACKRP